MADKHPLWGAGSQAERLVELTAEDPALKEAPLRRDVRSLGKLLGQVIREQEGEEFYEAVERLRHLAMEHRELEDAVLALRRPGNLVAFWDVDAPATLDRAEGDPADPFRAEAT